MINYFFNRTDSSYICLQVRHNNNLNFQLLQLNMFYVIIQFNLVETDIINHYFSEIFISK